MSQPPLLPCSVFTLLEETRKLKEASEKYFPLPLPRTDGRTEGVFSSPLRVDLRPSYEKADPLPWPRPRPGAASSQPAQGEVLRLEQSQVSRLQEEGRLTHSAAGRGARQAVFRRRSYKSPAAPAR